MTEPIYTVYKITNNINNKIYIGVHKTTNPNDNYMGSGIAIKHAIEKYGKSNFTKSILFEYNNPTEAYIKERKIVNTKFIKHPHTYNMIVGGNIISNHTEQKMSKSKIGRKASPETREKMSKSRTGYKMTETSKRKLSIQRIGQKNYQFSGYYITPNGKFETYASASTDLISPDTINTWCKKSNKTISKYSLVKSKYLQSLKVSPLGKTFKEIGFDFEPIIS